MVFQKNDSVYANKFLGAFLPNFFVTKVCNFDLILTSESLFCFPTDILRTQRAIWFV